jgi:hypothetical protein
MAEPETTAMEDAAALQAEVASMSQENDLRVPVFGHSSEQFKLPCGYVDPEGKVHNVVVMRQMTGVEEDMMANDNLAVPERVNNILRSCCEKIGDVEDRKLVIAALEDNKDLPEGALPVTAADRLAMLLFLRIASVGDTYRYDTKCPHCEKDNEGNLIDLRTLEIKYVKDPTKRVGKVKLPRSKVEVELKILTAKGEAEVTRLNPNQANARTLALMARIVTIGGKPVPPHFAGIELVKQMPYQDRIYLRKVFDFMEGSIDTEIEVVCGKPTCEKIYKFALDLGQVFFSPQGDTVTPDSIEWM